MKGMSGRSESVTLRNIWSLRDRLWLPASALVCCAIAIAWGAGRWALAVYALSFWHYGVYALAYFWRAVPLPRFKSDAILLKSLSLCVLAAVYAPGVSSLASVLVVLSGFALNIAAARAIGSDRTYYGHELASLPAKWSSAFPFSLLPHPMLTGNAIAFCGLLLDPGFREDWAPLAILHVLLNLSILAMEIYGKKDSMAGSLWPLGALSTWSLLIMISFSDIWPFALAAVAANAVFGAFLFHRYTRTPVSRS
jgi:hypothetical protein